MSLKVLSVAAECFPFVKAGGLADVLGALPSALRRLGVDARVLLPGFEGVLKGLKSWECLREWPDLMGGGKGRLLRASGPEGAPIYALEIPGFFEGLPHPYEPRPDLARRFGALSWVGAEIAKEGDGAGWKPDILHAHDWPAALAPAYLAFAPGPRVPSLMTIHNLAYQGFFSPSVVPEVWLPAEAYGMEGAELNGRLSFLKAGLHFATKLSTVSPTYAQEIQTPAGGCGLEGLLSWRSRDLVGILNGVDQEHWDPARSPHLRVPYDLDHLNRRCANKAALQEELGLEQDPGRPILGVVSRMEELKGLDLLLSDLDSWLDSGGQLAVLGSGNPGMEEAFHFAILANPGRVAGKIGYDESLAHRIFAGVDLFAVPSRLEPCGLTQLYALRYGAPPLVRRTGGLADTVVDATPANLAAGTATGFVFDAPEAPALGEALRRGRELFRDKQAWERLQRRGMALDFGWEASARRYLELFESML